MGHSGYFHVEYIEQCYVGSDIKPSDYISLRSLSHLIHHNRQSLLYKLRPLFSSFHHCRYLGLWEIRVFNSITNSFSFPTSRHVHTRHYDYQWLILAHAPRCLSLGSSSSLFLQFLNSDCQSMVSWSSACPGNGTDFRLLYPWKCCLIRPCRQFLQKLRSV